MGRSRFWDKNRKLRIELFPIQFDWELIYAKDNYRENLKVNFDGLEEFRKHTE